MAEADNRRKRGDNHDVTFIELAWWGLFAAIVFILVLLGLVFEQTSDFNMQFTLAVLILPLLGAFAGMQLAVYGAAAFGLNLILAAFRIPGRLVISLIVLAVAGFVLSWGLNAPQRAALAQATAHDVQKPVGKADVVALILPADSVSENGDPALCDDYCLRLLYSGEAKTVLMGVSPNGLDFTPAAVPVRAFSIARGQSCAPDLASPGDGSEEAHIIVRNAVAEAVADRSRKGECLASRPARVDEAKMVVAEHIGAVMAGGQPVNIRRIEVFNRTGGVLTLAIRKTLAEGHEAWKPLWFAIDKDGSVKIARHAPIWPHPRLERFVFLHEVAGLQLAAPGDVPPDGLRDLVGSALDTAALSDAGHHDIDSYLQSLQHRAAGEDDMRLVARIVNDPRVTSNDMFALPVAVKVMGDDAAPLAPVFVKTMRTGDVTSDGGRIATFSTAFALMPHNVQAQYYPDLLKLTEHPERIRLTAQAITRLAYAPPSEALPVFTRLAMSDGDLDRDARDTGEMGLCLMRPDALSAKGMILDRAVRMHHGYALLVAVWRLGAWDDYVRRRKLEPRDSWAQRSDEQDFERFPREIVADARRGGAEEMCKT